MNILEGVLLSLLGLLAALPALLNLKALWAVNSLPHLGDVEPDLEAWPRLSVVVAACNEEGSIEAAARTLLGLNYPDLEIIVVDDRSEDATGAIVDRLADEDRRMRVVHVDELPEGWLGKTHALERGTRLATGEFVVFADADVHFAPDALRRVVTLCEREKLGHLAVMPCLHGSTLAIDATIALFGALFLTNLDAHEIGRPDSKAYAGVGAFGLVRRSDFERTEGWSRLRMEVLDDVGLGWMMVREAGARSMLLTGGSELRVLWHPTVPALIKGLEKNGFVGLARGHVGSALGIGILLPAAFLALGLALLSPSIWLRMISGISLLSALPLAYAFRTRLAHPFRATLFAPLGLPVLGWSILRSTWLTLRRGGILWRGTFYSLEALRAGQRVE